MTKRDRIIRAIYEATETPTINYMLEKLGGERPILHQNIKSAVNDGFVVRGRDDVTGLPCYSLTEKGKRRAQALNVTTPAAGGANISGSRASVSCVAGSRESETSAEGAAVVEAAKLDEPPAEPASDVIPPPAYDPREVCFDPVERAEAWKGRAEQVEAMLDAATADLIMFSRWLADECMEFRIPINLAECKTVIAEALARKDARIAELEANESLPLSPANAAAAEQADMVNHPPHYQGKVECIDAIESALGPEGFAAYCRGNAIKYTFRAGRKGDAAQDIAKAGWYLRRITA